MTSPETEPETNRTPTYGGIAVAFGALAFVAVVAHFFAGPLDPPPPLEISIAEKAVDIRDATVAALKGEAYSAKQRVQPRTLDDYLTLSFMVAAALAVLLAIVGFIRHERWRPGVAGAALGGMAIAFQFATVVFIGLLCAIVLAAVIDKLDFSF